MTLDAFKEEILKNKKVLVYMSSPNCGVCTVMEEKVISLHKKYNDFKLISLNSSVDAEIAGQYIMLSAPTVCLFYEEKEVYRGGGYIDLSKLTDHLEFYNNL